MRAIKQSIILALCLVPFIAGAYSIGGAYAALVSCTWGQYGNQYGNIGVYRVNGALYQVFFGSSYCQM